MHSYYIVLDLEMNPTAEYLRDLCDGLGAETVEIGAVKIDARTKQIVDEFTCLIRPEFNYRMEPRITRLTGITTCDVSAARTFSHGLSRLTDWIGREPVRIYSWSNSDYNQLIRECSAKHIPFPSQLADWTDFQAEYPKYLGYSRNRCLSLKKAAQLIGASVVPGQAHRALYDAQITAQLVQFALTERYRHYTSSICQEPEARNNTMTYSIGDACGGKLAALLTRLNANEESEERAHVRQFHGTAAAFVR